MMEGSAKKIIKSIKSLERKEEVQFARGRRSGAGRFKDARTMNRVPIVEVAPRGCSYAPKGVEKRRGTLLFTLHSIAT